MISGNRSACGTSRQQSVVSDMTCQDIDSLRAQANFEQEIYKLRKEMQQRISIIEADRLEKHFAMLEVKQTLDEQQQQISQLSALASAGSLSGASEDHHHHHHQTISEMKQNMQNNHLGVLSILNPYCDKQLALEKDMEELHLRVMDFVATMQEEINALKAPQLNKPNLQDEIAALIQEESNTRRIEYLNLRTTVQGISDKLVEVEAAAVLNPEQLAQQLERNIEEHKVKVESRFEEVLHQQGSMKTQFANLATTGTNSGTEDMLELVQRLYGDVSATASAIQDLRTELFQAVECEREDRHRQALGMRTDFLALHKDPDKSAAHDAKKKDGTRQNSGCFSKICR